MSLDDLAQASCAVYCDGYRDGTGTLVSDSYVLTAAHVLRRGGPLTIRFRDGLSAPPIPVERLLLTAEAEQLDIAVLKLRGGVAEPPPAKLWPTKRLPPETKAFGYPIVEGAQPQGMWLDSRLGGEVQGGRVQLDWDEVGALPGHSGGPVCDKASGLMAGILVEGSTAGHFDRMVSLAAIRTIWNGLPRPWLFAGESARMHFTQRAAGQQSIASGGDLFKGRAEALAVIRSWFCARSALADSGPPTVSNHRARSCSDVRGPDPAIHRARPAGIAEGRPRKPQRRQRNRHGCQNGHRDGIDVMVGRQRPHQDPRQHQQRQGDPAIAPPDGAQQTATTAHRGAAHRPRA